MAKLNQIIAIEKGIKSRVCSEVSELYKTIQKNELFVGFNRTYEPLNDGEETLPEEKVKVKYNVKDVVDRITEVQTELFDITYRKDATNCLAKANVVIDDKVILEGIPATNLLFMEKQLVDLRTFISNLPVLDEADDWKEDANSNLYKSEATKTHRNKKISKPIVLYPATPEHPAQTQMVTEDVLAGYWKSQKISGAIPKPKKLELLSRVETLLKAVKIAREEANSIEEVSKYDVGDRLLTYIFGK